jgi:hypothetical protein
MPRIFISYRREDSGDAAGRLCDRLQTRFGRSNVFMDVDSIPYGVDFPQHLAQTVSRCDVLLVVIGERWLEARYAEGPKQGQRRLDDPEDFVRIEIQSALARDIPVVPVLIGQASMPRTDDLIVSAPTWGISLPGAELTSPRERWEGYPTGRLASLRATLGWLRKPDKVFQSVEPKAPCRPSGRRELIGSSHREDLSALSCKPLDGIGLDFYHFAENVHEARRAVSGEEDPQDDKAAGNAWAAGVLHLAKHESYVKLEEAVWDWAFRWRGAKRKAALGLLNYMSEREDMIRYQEFAEVGRQIGSGPTESMCKSTRQKVKGRGMRWDGDKAEALMAIEALEQSSGWQAYWDSLLVQAA